MRNKLCIIITYFGKFQNTINPFLKSCEYNKEFQWLIFTDSDLPKIPENVRIIKMTLSDMKALVEKKLGMEISLEKPYKMCDFRGAYGLIFADYIKGYDFWGYGDVDLVYGNLSRFVTDELCEYYDKIFPCGHLSFIRNTAEINRIYEKDTANSCNYKDVFQNERSYIFDEYKGINEKMLSVRNDSVYGKFDFVDIDIIYNRLRRVDKRTMKLVFPQYLFRRYAPVNYKHQSFYWDRGKAFVEYIDRKGKLVLEEVAYIHYRKKIDCFLNMEKTDSYYITSEGFKEKLENSNLDIVKQLNPYPGFFYEQIEFLKAFKDQMIYRMGKNRKLRNIVRIIKGKGKI